MTFIAISSTFSNFATRLKRSESAVASLSTLTDCCNYVMVSIEQNEQRNSLKQLTVFTVDARLATQSRSSLGILAGLAHS